jgi:F-type H+-transporting ATPase subunit gamma
LFKHFHVQYESKKDAVVLFVIGKKARDFALKHGYEIVGECFLRDSFVSDDLSVLYTLLYDAYQSKRYARMTIYYNYFKNTMTQVPVGLDLMPLSMEACQRFMKELDIVLPSKPSGRSYRVTHIELEPNRQTIIKKAYEIMMRIVVYGAVLHNKTGEFAARMLAMKGAKDNATSIISRLTLAYNKARQDAITKEVLEIVSAKAVIED